MVNPLEKNMTVGNSTITIEKDPVPVNLRTMMYMDAKKVIKVIGKFVVAGILIVLLYHYFGIWGIATFVVMFLIAYFWLIPYIAEKFMTYVNLVCIELVKDKPEVIKIVQISHARFQSALVLDDNNQKSALNAPFLCILGWAYIVDRIELDFKLNGLEDIPVDVIRVHDIHRNIDFVKLYEPEFLALRVDFLVARNELFALKTRLELLVEERANEKCYTMLCMVEDVLNQEGLKYEDYENLEKSIKEIREMLALGLDLSETKHQNLISNALKTQPDRKVAPVPVVNPEVPA